MVLHDITFAVVHEFQIKGIENMVYSKHYQWLWFSVLNLFTDMIRIPLWIRSFCQTTCCRRFALCFVGPTDSRGWPYKMTPVHSFVRLSFRPFEDSYAKCQKNIFFHLNFDISHIDGRQNTLKLNLFIHCTISWLKTVLIACSCFLVFKTGVSSPIFFCWFITVALINSGYPILADSLLVNDQNLWSMKDATILPFYITISLLSFF